MKEHIIMSSQTPVRAASLFGGHTRLIAPWGATEDGERSVLLTHVALKLYKLPCSGLPINTCRIIKVAVLT